MIDRKVWKSIGVPVNDLEEAAELIEKVQRNRSFTIKTPIGHYDVWHGWVGEHTKVTPTFYVGNENGKPMIVYPHLRGEGRAFFEVRERFPNERTRLSGLFLGNLQDRDKGIPIVLHCDEFGRHEASLLAFAEPLQISGLATDDVRIFDTEIEFRDYWNTISENDCPKMGQVFPRGLLQPDGSLIEEPPPYAILTGQIIKRQTVKNSLTGKSFYWLLLQTDFGTMDLALPVTKGAKLPIVGKLVFGVFWMSGRLIETEPDPEPFLDKDKRRTQYRLDPIALRYAFKQFADSGALRTIFDRSHHRPKKRILLGTVLILTGILIPAGIIVIFLALRERNKVETLWRRYLDLSQTGEPLMAHLVFANRELWTTPGIDAPALVIGSFDQTVRSGILMKHVAEPMAAYIGQNPEHLCGDQKALAQFMRDKEFKEGRRRTVPGFLRGSLEVFAFDLMIHSECLHTDTLIHPFIPCIAEPGTVGVISMIPAELLSEALIEVVVDPPIPE